MANTPKHWVVTTSGNRSLEDVAKDLRKSGLKVEEVLSEIGCITGVGGEGAAKKARKIDGVSDVSADAAVSVGPPDSSETW
jgi:hypothetical protein